jgi:patatin-like phospholipase/acyl hydrolase
MLPLFLIDYIENETYRYAEEKNYLTSPKANQKLPVSKFFDSIVGTSIGGLAAAGFAVPDKD